MKRLNRISVLPLLLLSVSCSLEQITDENIGDANLVRFTASMECSSTKTMISGDPSSPEVIWDEDDEIGIGVFGEQFRTFKNIAGETANGVFEGNISDSEDYYAVYPYQSSTVSTSLEIELPAVQKYRAGSFDKNALPMVGKVKAHKEIYFQLLCGVLEVQLTGTEKVMSIIFSGTSEDGTDAPVAGIGRVKWTYSTSPNLVMDSSGRNKVILDCGEGVMLNPDTPTSFYIVLPPVSLQGIKIEIFTKEGNYMSKVSTKAFDIRRSVITRISPLSVVTEPLDNRDLSLLGTSNCYIIPDAGDYSFDATVAGNGEFGVIDGMTMFADSPYINPVSAELLWEDHEGMIGEVTFTDGRIRFTSTGIEGNALIAAKDADGKILWSWHIWCTDKPVDHFYKNSYGKFNMMDRNLGATRADHGNGDEWRESCGLGYQWGRKEPFVGGLFTSTTASSDLAFSLENPTIKMSNWSSGYWSPSAKSIYDPCPVGYMVCSMDAWRGFSIDQVSGEYENGFNFIYDGKNSAWYPNMGRLSETGISYSQDFYMWSSSSNTRHFCFRPSDIYFNMVTGERAAYLAMIRCMKE